MGNNKTRSINEREARVNEANLRQMISQKQNDGMEIGNWKWDLVPQQFDLPIAAAAQD